MLQSGAHRIRLRAYAGHHKMLRKRAVSQPKAGAKQHAQTSIIGAGRLGTALGHALRVGGYQIKLLVTKRSASARRASRLLGGQPPPLSAAGKWISKDRVRHGLLQSDLIIIATPDDALSTIAEELSAVFRSEPSGVSGRKARVVLHTSGAISSAVLSPLRSSKTAIGSLHPLVSVADGNVSAEIFRGVYFCLEGDRKAVRVGRTLVKDLRGHSFTIDAKSKALYHAAAVMSAGHVVALFDLAVKMLVECGLSSQTAQQVLLPLLTSTTKNLRTKSPTGALTGPFARGDFKTVKLHLDAIKASAVAESLGVYEALGRHALKLAAGMSTDSVQTKRIEKLLRSRT